MSTKQKILERLASNLNQSVSGQELASELSISRTAVWKAIQALQQSGHQIIANTNQGYMLCSACDVLSAEGIRNELATIGEHGLDIQDTENPLTDLHTALPTIDLQIFDTVSSTNDLVKELAVEGKNEGLVVIASSQTKGRGRRGRSFFSPDQSGIYMSILLRPQDVLPGDALKITSMAAVAAALAIEDICDKTADIKWVNDILIDGKKVAGILTEASLSMENGRFEYVVLGMGVNIYPPDNGFPADILDIATSVLLEPQFGCKNKLVANFLAYFFNFYQHGIDYQNLYRSKSLVIGKDIWVIKGDERLAARAIDLDGDQLVVEYLDHTIETLTSGEISIRLKGQ